MRKTSISKSVALLAMSATIGLGNLGTASIANAAEIPNAITGVDIRQEEVDQYSQVTVDVTWQVPNNTAPGDTWTLNLPQELSAVDGKTFALRDPENGQIVANASIFNNVVTFVATDYVIGHANVTGTAFFTVSRASTTALNTPVPVTFTDSDGTPFNDTIQFNGVANDPADDDFYKWGKANDQQTLQWGILSPRPYDQNQTIVFEDTVPADAGFQFSCEPTSVSLYGHPNGLNGTGSLWLADNSKDPGFNGFTLNECSPTHIKATYVVQDWQNTEGVYWQPELRMTNVAITDTTVDNWTNEGNVTWEGNSIPVNAVVENANAGGEGSGDLIDIEKYTGTDQVAGDHDNAPGLNVAPGATTPITLKVTNTGSTNLTNVQITDTTNSGPAVTELSCTFPNGDTVAANAQNVVVWNGTLAPKDIATCQGLLPALDAATPHFDTASVTATGNGQVTDKDDFHATTTEAPVTPSVSVGDYTFIDNNKNGIQDDGDTPLPGVTITLTGPDGQPVTDINGNPVAPVVTDDQGHYEFINLPVLPAGQHYTVDDSNVPAGYEPTTAGNGDRATDSSTDKAESTDLVNNGDSDMTLDFGYVPTAAPTPGKVMVGDYVFYDNNKDGIQNDGDTPVVGATLTLTGPDGQAVTDVNGNPVNPVKTDDKGHYEFTNLPILPAGQHYNVAISDLPEGYVPTQAGVGDDRAVDSSTGTAESTDLTTDGASDMTLDFGIVPTVVTPTGKVTVGDYVFWDKNRDGIQNTGDTPIEGVTLTLTGPDGNAVTDINGNPVGTTVTDAKGYYEFTNLPVLPAGQHYKVTVTEPEGLEPTTAGAGTDRALDSSTGSAESTDLTTDGASDMTLDFGFVDCNCRVSVGDYVFYDNNKDGIQNDGDTPVVGATLTLTGPDGKPVIDKDNNPVNPIKTDDKGFYEFTNLPALPAGQHYTVTISDLPAGYEPTKAGAGDDRAKDSSTGSAESTDLINNGDSDMTLDFGIIKTPTPKVSIGDYVFVDTNKDGIQNEGDTPLPGVTLTVTGPDGKPVTDVDGNPVEPVKTDDKGYYEFTNLPALPEGQHYTVTVTPPEGYEATTPNAGDDRAKDSSTGSAESTDLTTDGAKDSTLDFGFIKTPEAPTPKVTVGDYVFYDNNKDGIQNEGDTPVVGMTLTLVGPDGKSVTDINGNTVEPVKTNDKGYYEFTNLPVLPAGQHYTVKVGTLEGYEPTKTGAGDRATDSSTGSAESTDLTTDGAKDMTLDFGFIKVEPTPDKPEPTPTPDKPTPTPTPDKPEPKPTPTPDKPEPKPTPAPDKPTPTKPAPTTPAPKPNVKTGGDPTNNSGLFAGSLAAITALVSAGALGSRRRREAENN